MQRSMFYLTYTGMKKDPQGTPNPRPTPRKPQRQSTPYIWTVSALDGPRTSFEMN